MNRVILISGKLQSGKNTFASLLKEELIKENNNVYEESFARILKYNCKEDFKSLVIFLNEFVENFYEYYGYDYPEICKEISKTFSISEDNWFENKTEITRILLQIYGTQIFRNRVDDNYWINKLIDKCKRDTDSYILITDCRFKNELSIFKKELDAVCVRINRTSFLNKSINEHQSEKDLDDYDNWDYMINNDGSIEDLKEEVKKFLILVKK